MAKTAGSQIKQKPKTNNKSCSENDIYIYGQRNGSEQRIYIFIYRTGKKAETFFNFFGQRRGRKWKKWAPQNKNKQNKMENKTNKRSNICHFVTNFRSRYFGFSLSLAISPHSPPVVCPFVLRNVFPKKKKTFLEKNERHTPSDPNFQSLENQQIPRPRPYPSKEPPWTLGPPWRPHSLF